MGKFNEIILRSQYTKEVSSNTMFQPVVNIKLWEKQYNWSNGLTLTAIAGTMVGTMVPIVGIPLSGVFDASTAMAAGLGSAFSFLALGGWSLYKIQKIFIGRQKAIANANKPHLRKWLDERYQISVDDEVADEISGFVSGPTTSEQFIEFKDISGRLLKINVNEDEGFFVTELPTSELPVQDYIATVISEEEHSTLTGEAATLFASAMSNFELLKNRDLSIESRHEVSRIRHDLNQVLQLNDELIELGQKDSESTTSVINILYSLNNELRQVLAIEIDSVKSQLSVQENYVKNRQFISSLTLENNSNELNKGNYELMPVHSTETVELGK